MPTDTDTITLPDPIDLQSLERSLAELSRQATAFSTAITAAFKAAVVGGQDFESVLKSLALKLSGIAFDRAVQPLSNIIGAGIEGLFGALGLPAAGATTPSLGGSRLPLERAATGALEAARPMVVNFNVATPDAASFRQAEAQVSAMLLRAAGRGRRGL